MASLIGTAARSALHEKARGCAVGVLSPDPDVRVRLEVRNSGGESVQVAEVSTDGLRIDVAPGSSSRAFASAPGTVVWPRSQPLREGGEIAFHVEPLRSVRLALPVGAAPRSPPRLRFIPDRFVVPPGPPDRVDALQAWIDVQTPECSATSGAAVVLLPATAWWVLGEVGGCPLRARVEPDDTSVALESPAPRAILREPTVDGRPVPERTLLAPGRLDVAAVAAVRSLVEDGAFRGAAIRGPGPWTAVALPGDPWLTLAHPSFGVVHVRWDSDVLADVSPPPGALAFVRRGGGTFTGHVAAWPAWPGTGDVFSRPSDRYLRVGVADRDRLVLRGLPTGEYRYDWSAAPGNGLPGSALRHGRLSIDPSRPETVVELDMAR